MRNKFIFLSSILLLVALSVIYFNLPEDTPNQLNSVESVTEDETDEEAQTSLSKSEEIADEIKESVEHALGDTIEIFIKDELKIVAIGDSLTEGVGDQYNNDGYVGILEDTFEQHDKNVGITNYGQEGLRSDQLLKKLNNDEVKESIEESDIVLVTIGANDIMQIVRDNIIDLRVEHFTEARANYVERLGKIFDNFKQLNPDTEVYLIGFYNPFEKYFGEIDELNAIVDNWNKAGETVTSNYDEVHFIPTKDIFQNSYVNLLADDNFHPNAYGYKLIAERVLNSLSSSVIQTD